MTGKRSCRRKASLQYILDFWSLVRMAVLLVLCGAESTSSALPLAVSLLGLYQGYVRNLKIFLSYLVILNRCIRFLYLE